MSCEEPDGLGRIHSSTITVMDNIDQVEIISPTQQIISSTVGAFMTSLIVTPFDVVKIRLQAQQKNFYQNKCFIYSNGLMEHLCYCVNGNGGGHLHGPDGATINIDPRHIKWYKRPIAGHFSGTFDALVKISRTEGIGSLWSGLPPTLLMAVPATVVYFTAYDRMRVNIWKWCGTQTQPMWIPVFCGAAARCIAATVISPLELVRTKMQSKKLSYMEIGSAVSTVIKNEGTLSLWRGLAPTLMRDVPFSSIYWASYEYLKQSFEQRRPTWQFSLSAGALSGSLAAIITLPFDVVKTHRQIELGEQEILASSKEGQINNNSSRQKTCKSTGEILAKIYRHHGVSGLFSGIVPRVMKVAPSCAIMISVYELGKQFFAGKLNTWDNGPS